MSRNTPVTPEFFARELYPWFLDTVGLLLDDETIMEDENGNPRSDYLRYEIGSTHDVRMFVRLPRVDAGRIIGKQHSMRESLYHVFRGICANHGFHLVSLEVYGIDDHSQTQQVVDRRVMRR